MFDTMFDTRTCLFEESPTLAIIVCVVTFLVQRSALLFSTGAFVFALLLFFYRVPTREKSKEGLSAIVSPCDGEITEISRQPSGAIRIVVYLSPMDVHLQWYPTYGVVVDKKYVPGEFNLAKVLRKSDYNERSITVIRAPQGWVRVDQIAGQLARRIVNRSEIGDVVRRGEHMGMIKLSSRVDLHVPARSTKIYAKVGDRVVGGVTTVAHWRSSSPTRGPRRPLGALLRRRGVVVHDRGGGGGTPLAAAPTAPEKPHAGISVDDAPRRTRRARRRAHAVRYKESHKKDNKT